MGIIFRQTSSPNTGPNSVKGTELTWQEADGNWAYLESITVANQASFNTWTGSVNSKFAGTSSFALTSSYTNIASSASYFFTGSVTSASIAITSSYANQAATASYFFTGSVTSASYSISSSYAEKAVTASLSNLAISASFANTASYLSLQDIANSTGYTNDSTAAAAGIPIGGVYRNGNFLLIRVS